MCPSNGPSDGPPLGGPAIPPGVAAARFTLLVLRADLPGGTRASATHAILSPDTAPRPVDAVARQLVALPPPMRCRATVRDGHVVVAAEPFPRPRPRPVRLTSISDLSTDPVVRFVPPEDPTLQTLGFLYEQHGPAAVDLAVVCVGAGEALRLTAGEFRAWERDYVVVDDTGRQERMACSIGGFDPTASEADRAAWVRARGVVHDATPGAVGAAHDGVSAVGVSPALLAGAVAVLVYACTDEAPEVRWTLRPEQAPALWCEDCGRRRAEHRILTRGNRATGGVERERVLCEPCYFMRQVTPGVRAQQVERLLDLFEPDEATASADDCQEHAALLVRYAEKLGLPLADVSYEWAAFARRHPPDA